jgi:hypothetical protein
MSRPSPFDKLAVATRLQLDKALPQTPSPPPSISPADAEAPAAAVRRKTAPAAPQKRPTGPAPPRRTPRAEVGPHGLVKLTIELAAEQHRDLIIRTVQMGTKVAPYLRQVIAAVLEDRTLESAALRHHQAPAPAERAS